jgi:hypothetical protein
VTKNAQGKIRVKAYHDLLEPVGELSNDLWGGILSSVVFHRSLAIAQEIFNPDFLFADEPYRCRRVTGDRPGNL